MTTKKKDVLIDEVYGAEGYLTALFWANPEWYNSYPKEKINSKTFANPNWAYFFGLGSYMYEKGITIFDDISVSLYAKETKTEAKLKTYGNYDTMEEIIEEVKDRGGNIEGYYQEVKKYALLRSLREYFGDKVVKVDGKYNYHKMTKEQLHVYWMDKINKLAFDGDNHFQEHYLLQGLAESIKMWNENPDFGLEFYNSYHMTNITNGWADGCLYLNGMFGGKGKTSITFNKVIMGCLAKKEKLLVIANEQEIEDFKRMLLVTAMGIGTKEYFVRKRLNEGSFTEEEQRKLDNAIKWIESITGEGQEKLIAFVFMESYNMTNVRKIVTHFAHRGYRKLLIDTGKPSDSGSSNTPRWQQFTEDMTDLYSLIRPSGLNIGTWVNVQLADSALTHRFLNEMALGDSRKIKNEATVVFLARNLWDDEYAGENHALKVWRWVKSEFSEQMVKEEFELDRFDKDGNFQQYALMFTAKNRRGMDNNTGQNILVFRVDLNRNIWKEVGWTTVTKDYHF